MSGYEILNLTDLDGMFTRLIEEDPLQEAHQCIRLVVVGTLLHEVVVQDLEEASSEEVMVLQDHKVILPEAALDLVHEAVLQAPGMVVVEACLRDVESDLTIVSDHIAEVHQPVQGSSRLVVYRHPQQNVLHSQ